MHNPDNQISLKLTPDTTHAHCLFIMQQARNTSHALASLIALQSFVVAMAQAADIESTAFRVIKGIINGHIANLRAELLCSQQTALLSLVYMLILPAMPSGRPHKPPRSNWMKQRDQESVSGR